MINYSGRKTPDHYHYEMVRCNRCRLLFASSIYDNEMVEDLYLDSAFDYGDDLIGLKKTYGRSLKLGMRFLKRKKRMVDIGCGNGFLLEEAIKYDWEEVFGVELSKKAINCANPYVKKKIINKPFYADHFLENHFDLVFSAMVVEHITDINKFFSDVKKILCSGGVQVIIAHNEGHFLSRILKNKHPIINDEHINVFTPKTLKIILLKHQFEIIHVQSLRNYYSLNYWIKMFPMNSQIRTITNHVFNKTNLGVKQIGIKAGNFVLVARKR